MHAMPSWSNAFLVGAAVLVAAAIAMAGDDPSRTPRTRLPAPGGDGDSWRDTQGREYRLGLVDTPEVDACFGPEATQERQRLTADGFRADVYAKDEHGRGLAVVTLPDGRVLNVHLARQGLATDRYLARVRSEHPGLATQLDPAFAEARREGRGLWGACRSP